MAFKLLLLISALTLVSATGKAQDHRPEKTDLAWGDYSRGLRMAVWTNPEADRVFSVMRDFSTQKVSYEIGGTYYEVYARRDTDSTWRRIELKPVEPRVVIPLGGCYIIQPKEEVKSYVDLHAYDFPADWNGLVEVRIVGVLTGGGCDKSYKIAKVKSRTLNVKLPLTGAAAPR